LKFNLRRYTLGDVRTRVPYRSCAVVGSSGAVLSYENGASIDMHAMVGCCRLTLSNPS
jgi:hypothetical protein